MKREERYAVFKYADIDAALSDSDKLLLSAVVNKIDRYRKEQGKEPIKGVVVEHDWPEYEQVWKMIEERVDREDNNRKFETMLDNKERLGYFFVVETHQGKFLITSNAHSTNRLTKYSGYTYRAMFSPDCGFDNSEIFTTSWSVYFKRAIMVSFDEIIALYDPNVSVSNYNIAEFIEKKLTEAKQREIVA
ncbi:MAG: hypothetical protein [Enterobacter phage ENC7]|nr:MAG: hypothetical protein [Enterobacter phage ENC7]UIW11785.1 MAG: hypothetical protein [Enterobacter phage ENC25]UIW12043.1 MAG: hypothetical protein [Enterobacter phage ENC22]